MPMPIVVEIGTVVLAEAVVEKRKELRMTRVELARQMGIIPESIRRWEIRKTFPRPELLSRVAEWLGIDEEYLRR